ncbi:winged helix-turn-helix transcriptional regulator [Dyella choica]|uniref:Transcriptional regulator n=1 Tax=Dyella choica TaxID=1927959 RepID=A0A432M7S9_9GAMM|nr:helix-turn-helix domain-containing protein [Dyella choica]RUL77485.1 transcriptional regulator [Dyella choica]
MRRVRLDDANCPVARTLDEIGDWWTLLIVRDAFVGRTRFSEFQKSLGLAKNILAERLKMLVANGILEKRPASDGGARSEYHLTDKGRDLRLILIALRQWGEDHLFEDGEDMTVIRDPASQPIARLRLANAVGEELGPEDIRVVQGHKKRHAKAGRVESTLA